MAKRFPPLQHSIAALSAELPASVDQPPTEFRLFPAGRFRAIDGQRPDKPAAGWLMNAQVAGRLIAAAKARLSDYVIDYEHQTLHAAKNGQPAPAAAWFHDLEWREGDGLYVIAPNWTAAAANRVTGNEYRYVSPVFAWDRISGEVTIIHHAALVNDPGLDGLTDFSALAANFPETNFSEEEPMELLTKLFVAAGLAAPADEAAATAALANLKTAAAQVKPLETEVAALKATTSDPSKFVPLATYQAATCELAALKASQVDSEVDALVKEGLADGRLQPPAEAWARDLGKASVASLKQHLELTKPLAALSGKIQTGGKTLDQQAGTLSDVELAVCKAQGISAEDFLKTKTASA